MVGTGVIVLVAVIVSGGSSHCCHCQFWFEIEMVVDDGQTSCLGLVMLVSNISDKRYRFKPR